MGATVLPLVATADDKSVRVAGSSWPPFSGKGHVRVFQDMIV